MVHETTIRTRYSETDQMGVIYHANYFNWFEIGRTAFFRELGMTYKSLEAQKVLLPVIDARCKYIVAAEYDEEILIKIKLTKLRGVKIKFEYEVYRNKDEELLAEGYTLHAFVDKDLEPINFKKKFQGAWNLLNDALEMVEEEEEE